MKKSIIVSVSLLFFITALQAQLYTTAGGLRVGTDWGFTIQQRIANRGTAELIIQNSLQREETLITILGEHHYPLVTKGFNVYTGAGLHKGWLTVPDSETKVKDPFGFTFVLGAELTFGRFNVSYDFKPALNLSGGERTFYTQSGVSLRYVLVKNKVYKNWQKDKKKERRKKEREENGKTDWWRVWER